MDQSRLIGIPEYICKVPHVHHVLPEALPVQVLQFFPDETLNPEYNRHLDERG